MNCSLYRCAYDVHNYDAQQHRAGQIISPLTLQTITIAQVLSVGGERAMVLAMWNQVTWLHQESFTERRLFFIHNWSMLHLCWWQNPTTTEDYKQTVLTLCRPFAEPVTGCQTAESVFHCVPCKCGLHPSTVYSTKGPRDVLPQCHQSSQHLLTCSHICYYYIFTNSLNSFYAFYSTFTLIHSSIFDL